MRVNMHDTVDSYEKRQGRNFNDIMGGVMLIFLGAMLSFIVINIGFLFIIMGFVWIYIFKRIHKKHDRMFRYD